MRAFIEEAAAVPMAAGTALQGLGRPGPLPPGQRVLINGGTGGVGSFAVQLARAAGAEVTAVTSPANLELVPALGADHVGRHHQHRLPRTGRRYDRILDTVGNRSVPELRRALTEGDRARGHRLHQPAAAARGSGWVAARTSPRSRPTSPPPTWSCCRRRSRRPRSAPGSTGAIRSSSSPPPSPTWNKATPGPRSPWP